MATMGLLLILILFLAIWYFVSSRKQIHRDLNKKPNQMLETQAVSQAAFSEKTDKDSSKKTLEKSGKSSISKTENKSRNYDIQKQEQAKQHEAALVQKDPQYLDLIVEAIRFFNSIDKSSDQLDSELIKEARWIEKR